MHKQFKNSGNANLNLIDIWNVKLNVDSTKVLLPSDCLFFLWKFFITLGLVGRIVYVIITLIATSVLYAVSCT